MLFSGDLQIFCAVFNSQFFILYELFSKCIKIFFAEYYALVTGGIYFIANTKSKMCLSPVNVCCCLLLYKHKVLLYSLMSIAMIVVQSSQRIFHMF